MILTTTNSIDGFTVSEYRGIVFGEVIAGVDFIKDLGASFRNFFGGRSQGYEEELMSARNSALSELQERAFQMGANAVIGIKLDYETLGGGGMLMVTASGTAVVVR